MKMDLKRKDLKRKAPKNDSSLDLKKKVQRKKAPKNDSSSMRKVQNLKNEYLWNELKSK